MVLVTAFGNLSKIIRWDYLCFRFNVVKKSTRWQLGFIFEKQIFMLYCRGTSKILGKIRLHIKKLSLLLQD